MTFEILDAEKRSGEKLREYAAKNPDCRDTLLRKAEFQDKKHKTLMDKDEFLNILNHVDTVLDTIENELAKHKESKLNYFNFFLEIRHALVLLSKNRRVL